MPVKCLADDLGQLHACLPPGPGSYPSWRLADDYWAIHRVQTGKGLAQRPPFTLADIKNAIPAHCWKKDAWRSMAYLARDVAIVVGMAAAAYSINSWSGSSSCAPEHTTPLPAACIRLHCADVWMPLSS